MDFNDIMIMLEQDSERNKESNKDNMNAEEYIEAKRKAREMAKSQK